MGSILNGCVSARALRGGVEHLARLGTALALCLAIVAAGCGSKAKESAAGSEGKSGGSQKAEARSSGGGSGSAEKAEAKSAPKPAPKAAASAGGGGHIRLTERGCIEFEPHWATIRVGQSVTWHSDLKRAVTIHVPAGAFDRTEYVVPAKGTVRTGPARESGDHAIWSMPAACQAAPHGVQGAGPGVSIESGS